MIPQHIGPTGTAAAVLVVLILFSVRLSIDRLTEPTMLPYRPCTLAWRSMHAVALALLVLAWLVMAPCMLLAELTDVRSDRGGDE